MSLIRLVSSLFICFVSLCSHADFVLMGNNTPHKNVNDGNFDLIAGWQIHDSPYWRVNQKLSVGKAPTGVAKGVLTATNALSVIDSIKLENIPEYSIPIEGDVLHWQFTARAEHESHALASFSLVFANQERMLAEKVALQGGPHPSSFYQGEYQLTKEDSKLGMPFIRLRLYSENSIKLFVEQVDLRVIDSRNAGPNQVKANVKESGIKLSWQTHKAQHYNLYRKIENQKHYQLLVKNITQSSYVDNKIISGVYYQYAVTQVINGLESNASETPLLRTTDNTAPSAPTNLNAKGLDTEVELSWQSADTDIKQYLVFKSDGACKQFSQVNTPTKKPEFVDILAAKSSDNCYRVRAEDYSGNLSPLSQLVKTRVKAVHGAAFSDLLQPMPIHKALRDDLWGAQTVLPRDPDNGIEHSDWSYWGGDPTLGKDGKYHMLVVRWPEGAQKGHWEWPWSTVAYTVSDKPTGPYRVVKDRAYEFADGFGHNADVIELNDGRFLLYSLINWKPTLLVSDRMKGPWKVLGEMVIEYDSKKLEDKRRYQVERNLSGVQLDDGSMLFVTKFGRMIKSESGLLGPYKVLTDTVNQNSSIPSRYRQSNYEDPVMWKDDVQYHQIINAFLDYRAIYLRSGDGINWKFDTGLAYTPQSTRYENGHETKWYKLERPHVIQDQHKRATHLSLAVIDTVKRQDFANDAHSAKNIIIPLTKHKRLTLLSPLPISQQTKTIHILIHKEDAFDPLTDINLDSLRYGASEAVNFGRGSKLIRTETHQDGLVLVFNGKDTELNSDNFASKLLGKTQTGELIIGFTKR